MIILYIFDEKKSRFFPSKFFTFLNHHVKIPLMSNTDNRIQYIFKGWMRKVRAPQGRVPDNVRWRQLPG